MASESKPIASPNSPSESSWTMEDDSLFEQLISELSQEQEFLPPSPTKTNESSAESISKKRELLVAQLMDELNSDKTLAKEEVKDDSIIGKQKEEEPAYESFREWLEINRRIIDMEKEQESLRMLELFIQHKEQQFIKRIVSQSAPPETVKKLFFKDQNKM